MKKFWETAWFDDLACAFGFYGVLLAGEVGFYTLIKLCEWLLTR